MTEDRPEYAAYDAATPAGCDPGEGVEPRVRLARPGSALDDVYASRYRRLEHVRIRDGVVVDIELAATDDDATVLKPGEAARVAAAIADETPPEARKRRT